jgi:hypothetical protein
MSAAKAHGPAHPGDKVGQNKPPAAEPPQGNGTPAAPVPLGPPAVGDYHGGVGDELKRDFKWVFKFVTVSVFVVIIVMSFALTASGFVFQDRLSLVIATRMLQLSLGMILGAACLVFGVLLSWFGIESAFRLGAGQSESSHGFRVALSSASPGIALIVGGVILIGICLWKEPEYERRGPEPYTPQPGPTWDPKDHPKQV